MLFLHVTVNQFNDLVGIKTICFTKVKEQTGKSRFCFASCLFTVTSAFFAFSAVSFAPAVCRSFYFFRIPVIFKEAIKFQRNHALDDIFFSKPFQFAIDSRKEIGYLFFVYFYLFNIIDHLYQLFLTDLLSRRHLTNNELLADNTFYLTHFAFLAHIDNGNGCSGFTGTSCSTATMCITFRIIGQSVIDNVGKIVHIQPSGSYIRCNQ